jgi:hypothetical protein
MEWGRSPGKMLFECKLKETYFSLKRTIVMGITPEEVLNHMPLIEKATGKVLVTFVYGSSAN